MRKWQKNPQKTSTEKQSTLIPSIIFKRGSQLANDASLEAGPKMRD